MDIKDLDDGGTWLESTDLIEERQSYSSYRKEVIELTRIEADKVKIKDRSKQESRQFYINATVILNDLCHHLMLNSNQDLDYGIVPVADDDEYITTLQLVIFKNREAALASDASQSWCTYQFTTDKSGEDIFKGPAHFKGDTWDREFSKALRMQAIIVVDYKG